MIINKNIKFIKNTVHKTTRKYTTNNNIKQGILVPKSYTSKASIYDYNITKIIQKRFTSKCFLSLALINPIRKETL
ncbi:hypothetical protein HERIO_2179 [Hepatospora eriocheir]|uniref:Uncharacterized protein n=1 Tax=Hepatospora eriocheir TaxID=1081669 RepID=A0A1X0Q7W6_9MICR|nr:hypothetical protein HERIO_2179 [Hepatospora eriocheir]